MMHPLFSFMLCYFCFFINLIFTRTTCQPLVYMCSNSTYTYGTNLNSLLSNLSSAGPRENGFYNYVVEGANATTVYGLFMCQGYASSRSCATCVKNASTDILRLCPKQKTAIIWYNRCMLRYSDESIMGRAYQTTEEQVIFMSCDTRKSNHSSQPIDLLMQRWLVNTLNVTISRLTGDRAGKKFVTREAKFSMGSDMMYVLGQCTPDLSDLDCQKCLSNGIQRLTDDCYSLGARAILPSCVLRYEKYPFYNTIAAASAPPPNYSVTTRPEGNFHGKSGNSSSKVIIAIVVPVIGIILLIAILCFVRIRNVKKKNTTTQTTDETGVSAEECLQYDFATVQAITNDFSQQSKIGEGGYGPVYKGMLPIGQEVAVKRLSRSSGQGAQEFKNEVQVVANLQHRNLVRLLGFCSQGEEKILIYEFVPNKSPDYFLFDPDKQYILEWSRRYKIIKGIARGLLYLHEDSRLRIIHRDLKASNILLDVNMDPKIADFGTAKIFGVDQTQGRTTRIVGTYGYMSPEYAMHGKFSIKSDIFSFGVLVLEIITGKKNNFFQSNKAQDLLSYAWEQWRDGLPLKILDPILGEYYTRNEVMQCMHIGLLCVQKDANERPTMVEVMLMLSSYSANNWSAPREPAFYRNGSEEMPKEIELEKPATINEVSISVLCPR